jgi:hypothetical protein
MGANGRGALSHTASRGCPTKNAPADGRFFPPVVALAVVKLAGERPDVRGRSLSPWERAALARQVVRDGVVDAIAPQTVQRMRASHTLTPWRHPRWLAPQVPRDAACAAQVHGMVPLSTRPLGGWDMGVCVDEPTSLQPRPRTAPPWAAPSGQPVRVEHESTRKGALHLFAGLAPRPGKVDATTAERKRPGALLTFLAHGDQEIAPAITTMPGVRDHLRMHKSQQVQAW